MAGERTIRIKIDGDGKGITVASVAAQAAVRRVERAVNDFDRRALSAGKNLTAFTVKLGALGAAVQGLTTVGAGLGAITGVLGGLPAIAAGAAAAAGTVALGMNGIGEAAKGLIGTRDLFMREIGSVFEGTLEPGVEAVKQHAVELLPTMKQLAGEIAGIGTAAAQTAVLPENMQTLNTVTLRTADLMAGVRDATPSLVNAFADIAAVGSEGFGSIGGLIAEASARFEDFISQARANGSLRQWIDDGVNALKTLGAVLGNIGAIIGSTFRAISEGAGGVGNAMLPAIKAIRDFVESAQGQSALRDIGAALGRIGDAIGRVLRPALDAIGPAIGPIANAFATFADVAASVLAPALRAVAPLLEAIGNFISDNAGLISTLVIGFAGLAATVTLVKGAISATNTVMALFNTITKLTDGGLTGLATKFGAVGAASRAAGLAMGAIGIVATLIGTAMAAFGSRSADAAVDQEKLAAAGKSVADVLREQNGQINSAVRLKTAESINEANKDALQIAKELGISLPQVTNAVLDQGNAYDQIRTKLENEIKVRKQKIELLGQQEGGNIAERDAIQAEVDKRQLLLDTINGVRNEKQREILAQEAAAEASRSGTTALEKQTAALDALIKKQQEFAGGVLSLRDAERNWQESLETANETVAKNGAVHGIATEAGRENEAMLDDLVDRTFALADAQQAQGATQDQITQTMANARAEFVRLAENMGYSTEEANALADQLRLIPGEYNAFVSVPGADEALKQLIDVNNKVRNLPPNTPVTVNALTDAAKQRLLELGFKIEEVPGSKNVIVTAPTDAARAQLNQFIIDSSNRSVTIPVHYALDPLPGTPGSRIHGRATGGPVLAGRSYVVGERGPEIFRPPNSGHIVPNHELQAGDVAIFISIDGQQLQGRIDRTIRSHDRQTKRTATSRGGGR